MSGVMLLSYRGWCLLGLSDEVVARAVYFIVSGAASEI
jgi:hypothetical protein